MVTKALTKRLIFGLLAFICLATWERATAEQPLSQDDVRLLLIGGATQEKMIALIEKRGVDFKMNPDLAKKFHDDGASDEVIEALQKAGERVASPKITNSAPTSASPPANAPSAPSPSVSSAGPAAAAPPSANPTPSAAERPPVSPTPMATTKPVSGANSAPPVAKSNASSDLTDPSPEGIQRIIREFAAKEKLFKGARDNYTYHQINKVETLDADGNVDGQFEQDWDILYDDSGKRIERVTYAPVDTLQRISVTAEDLNAMRNIQPFVLTTDELPEYDIKYLGHVKVDEITTYVFSIRPKEMQKGRQYFQGTVWVDDRDLQIVKSEGKNVPELKTKKGENLFPRFTTIREQIDGKFWFPTYTAADDKLYFSGQPPVHIKELIRYTDYKQFKSKVRIISAGEAQGPATSASKTTPTKP